MAPVTGTYTFTTTSDDGVRLYLNGQLLDRQLDRPPRGAEQRDGRAASPARATTSGWTTTTTRTLATARLSWAYPGQSIQIVPQWVLYPAPPVNQPPAVNAGADQTITLPAGASLDRHRARRRSAEPGEPDDDVEQDQRARGFRRRHGRVCQSERAGDDGDFRRRRHLRAAAHGERRRRDGQRRRDDHGQPRPGDRNGNRPPRRVLQRSRTTARTSSRSSAAGWIRPSTSTGPRPRRRPA